MCRERATCPLEPGDYRCKEICGVDPSDEGQFFYEGGVQVVPLNLAKEVTARIDGSPMD